MLLLCFCATRFAGHDKATKTTNAAATINRSNNTNETAAATAAGNAAQQRPSCPVTPPNRTPPHPPAAPAGLLTAPPLSYSCNERFSLPRPAFSSKRNVRKISICMQQRCFGRSRGGGGKGRGSLVKQVSHCKGRVHKRIKCHLHEAAIATATKYPLSSGESG